jgi:hypothetical protein
MRKSTKKIQEIYEFLSHTDLHTDQRAQKRHNLVEKPLKMADFLQYLLWRPYSKIYQKDHTQTGYIRR